MSKTIKLWKDNQLGQEWEITLDHLADSFWKWKSADLVESWPLERAFRAFITEHEKEGGLQSVFDEADFDDIYNAIRDTWKDHRGS